MSAFVKVWRFEGDFRKKNEVFPSQYEDVMQIIIMLILEIC